MSEKVKRNLIQMSIAVSQLRNTAYEQGFRWVQALFRSIGPSVANCDMTDIFQNEMEWSRSDFETQESDSDSDDSENQTGNAPWKWNGTADELLDLLECAIICQHLIREYPDEWYTILRQPDEMTDTAKKMGLTRSAVRRELKRLFADDTE